MENFTKEFSLKKSLTKYSGKIWKIYYLIIKGLYLVSKSKKTYFWGISKKLLGIFISSILYHNIYLSKKFS